MAARGNARSRRAALLVVALSAAGVATGAAAQKRAPPPPRPIGTAAFPPFAERTLSNGAKVIVATRGEVPFVDVDLVMRGGTSVDPGGKIGTAAWVAGLLTKGTSTRTADDIAQAIERLGGTLEAAAFPDWTTVRLGVLQPDLAAGLELMADVVMNPTFPEPEIDRIRARSLAALEAGMPQPAVLAERAFIRAVYGSHDYGKLPVPETLQAIDRVTLREHHRAWFHPSAALFVVSGPVTLDQASAALERAFGAWSRETVPAIDYGPTPAREGRHVILVHQPASVQASVQMGHLLPRGNDSGWTPFWVAEWLLGGPSGRLSRALRDGKGWAYEATASALWRPDLGVWRATFDARADVVVDAIAETLAQVERLRTEMAPAAEIDAAKAFWRGPVGWPVETGEDVAAQILTNRGRGLPDEALRAYRDRVQELDASDLKQAASEWLRPDEMVIVVVGDAVLLANELARFGPVTVIDADGRPLDTAVLLAGPSDERFDASRLKPGAFEYRILLQGDPVGTMKRELVADTTGGPAMAFRGTISLGPQTIDQEVVFGVPGFDARAARMTMDMAGGRVAMDARVRDGRLLGTVSSPAGNQPVSRAIPPGTLVADMVEMAVWIADLAVGKEIRVPVARLETGGVETQVMRVGPIEDVTVPAGTFEAYRVEIAGSEPQTVWARVAAPHVLLKLAPAGQPLTLELVALPPG